MNIINIPCIRGEKIDLCVLRTDDEAIRLYTKWMNDEDINMWVHHNDCTDQYNQEVDWANKKREKNENVWIIIEKETEKMIGSCSCSGNRNVNLGICIGEAEGRNKGYGTEAIKLMVKFAFEEKNAHRVYLHVLADNIRAYNCYKKIGFKKFGRERESGYYHGHYVDIIGMDMLKKEYFKLCKQQKIDLESISKL